MKTIQKSIVILILFTLMVSCGSDTKQEKKESKKESKKTAKTTSVVRSISPSLGKIRKISDEVDALKPLEPITNKALEDWVPESIIGLNKTNEMLLINAGLIGISAKYGKPNNKRIDIMIIDGHGEKNNAAIAYYVANKYENYNKQTSTGFIKTVEYEGTIVKEEFDDNTNSRNLTFLYNNRFGVEIKTKELDQNEVWSAFKEFDLDKIK